MASKKKVVPYAAVAADGLPSFWTRPASAGWERIPVEFGPGYFWAWYKPTTLPSGLVVRLPDEFAAANGATPSTPSLRALLRAAGVDAAMTSRWFLHGVPYEGLGGTNPYFDAPLPAPVPG